MKETFEIIIEATPPIQADNWLHQINYGTEHPFIQYFYESSWLETNAKTNQSIQRFCWSIPSEETYLISLIKIKLKQHCPQHYRKIERTLEEKLWKSPWQEDFSHLETNRFYIKELELPKNNQASQSTVQYEKIQIQLLPSSSFGKGDHASTEAILKLMEKYPGDLLDCQAGLDIGSGNGILSIAAIHLGVKKMYATEMEDEAYNCLKQNIKLNEMKNNIHAFHTHKVKVVSDFDLLIINVLSGALLPLIEEALLHRNKSKPTQIFLAGFNEQESTSIIDFMSQLRAELNQSLSIRGWCALKFTLNPNQ